MFWQSMENPRRTFQFMTDGKYHLLFSSNQKDIRMLKQPLNNEHMAYYLLPISICSLDGPRPTALK